MKKFLIIGSMNAIGYKEIFPLIKYNKMWLGAHNKIKWFISDDGGIKNISNVYWYTNMEHNKRNEPLILTKTYDPDLYPKYDNYNAVEVSRVENIPYDYEGIMGVPITFLNSYNPNQFEIIGEANHGKDSEWDLFTPSVDGKTIFKRILIKKVCIYEGDKNGNRVPDIDEWECRLLEGDGGFASEECIELLKEADIVVTNPPFSLFREYVALLMEYNKKFLIIGNVGAITYKEIFPLIKENKMWLGTQYVKEFISKSGEIRKFGNILWYTNLVHKKRNTPIDLYKHYNAEEFHNFDNYSAINVNKVSDIPFDYEGVIGVPVSFLDKYCPDQFEILGITDRQNTSGLRIKKYTESDSVKYNDLNRNGVIKLNGVLKPLYARLLIKRVSK